MRRHLYNLVKPCPGSTLSIELTTDIKEIVLKDRVYNPPVIEKPCTIIQTINQNNTIYNYISNIDMFVKLNKLAEHQNIEIEDFESSVDDIYKRDAHRFLNGGFRGNVEYNEDHFLNMISNVTESTGDLKSMNVLYDHKTDNFHFAIGSGNWDKYRRKTGLVYLIETIVYACLERYEVYLIRKLHNARIVEKPTFEHCLDVYYRFISTFDIKPYVHGKEDSQILYNEEDTNYCTSSNRGDVEAHRLVDACYTRYNRIREEHTDVEKKNTIKEVFDIVKQNSKTSIQELNKMILQVLHVDKEFEKSLITGIAATPSSLDI